MIDHRRLAKLRVGMSVDELASIVGDGFRLPTVHEQGWYRFYGPRKPDAFGPNSIVHARVTRDGRLGSVQFFESLSEDAVDGMSIGMTEAAFRARHSIAEIACGVPGNCSSSRRTCRNSDGALESKRRGSVQSASSKNYPCDANGVGLPLLEHVSRSCQACRVRPCPRLGLERATAGLYQMARSDRRPKAASRYVGPTARR
jgi:hypothetical protein